MTVDSRRRILYETRPMKRSRWALFRRFDIPDYADPMRSYLTRFVLLQTPWFGLYLHKIHLPDTDRHMHDHPWSFVSIVLRGGYDEFMAGVVGEKKTWMRRDWQSCDAFGRGIELRRRGFLSIGFRRAEQLHRVDRLYRFPSWTLVLAGRKRRAWGFQTELGWCHHDDYFTAGDIS